MDSKQENVQISENVFMINKLVGETPLECLERFRASAIVERPDFADIPMTYAGRLDPMAEGKLLILAGETCKNKEKYLTFDKTYEVELLFGIETDTDDVLGYIEFVKFIESTSVKNVIENIDIKKYLGKFEQEYPPFSSKTVGGKALHTLVRTGNLPEDMPTKLVEIYSITIEPKGSSSIMTGREITHAAIDSITKVTGDFRQDEIIRRWKDFGIKYENKNFTLVKIRIDCSSGTYMRSLVRRMGRDLGSAAVAFSICRTAIGPY